jgi:cell division protein FtsQ
MQQGVPRTARSLPGMPLDMEDSEDDNLPRARWGKKGEGSGRWWWPANMYGRVAAGLGASIVLVILITAGNIFKTYLQRDGRFRIAGASHIQAVGLTEVTRGQLLPVFGEDIGRNVFFVPLNERRKALESIPWIQQATVMRLLPDQIRVDIVERKPVAFTRHGQQIGLVDASGVLLEMAPSQMAAHHYSFPVLTGIDAGEKPASREARMAVYQRLISDLDGNGKRYSDQLSEIDLTDPEDARVLMPEQGADILAHFGEDHFLERFQRYKEHIAEWRQQYPTLAAVDLRYEHQVVLDMASGVSHTQANPDSASTIAATDVKTSEATASPAKPKPSAKAVSNRTSSSQAAHEKSAHENGKIRAKEKTATTGSAKAKSSASKSKGAVSKSTSKAAADKKHAASKTGARNKVAALSKTSASSRAGSQNRTKPATSSAARQTAAEGQ